MDQLYLFVKTGFMGLSCQDKYKQSAVCKVNPVHVVGDANHAIISTWLVLRLSPCMEAAWGRSRSRRVRRRLLMALRLMDGNKICVVPEFLEEQQSMHKTWEKIFLSKTTIPPKILLII